MESLPSALRTSLKFSGANSTSISTSASPTGGRSHSMKPILASEPTSPTLTSKAVSPRTGMVVGTSCVGANAAA